jgi:hypothetical protein
MKHHKDLGSKSHTLARLGSRVRIPSPAPEIHQPTIGPRRAEAISLQSASALPAACY